MGWLSSTGSPPLEQRHSRNPMPGNDERLLPLASSRRSHCRGRSGDGKGISLILVVGIGYDRG
jgi:hypothetical protein